MLDNPVYPVILSKKAHRWFCQRVEYALPRSLAQEA